MQPGNAGLLKPPHETTHSSQSKQENHPSNAATASGVAACWQACTQASSAQAFVQFVYSMQSGDDSHALTAASQGPASAHSKQELQSGDASHTQSGSSVQLPEQQPSAPQVVIGSCTHEGSQVCSSTTRVEVTQAAGSAKQSIGVQGSHASPASRTPLPQVWLPPPGPPPPGPAAPEPPPPSSASSASSVSSEQAPARAASPSAAAKQRWSRRMVISSSGRVRGSLGPMPIPPDKPHRGQEKIGPGRGPAGHVAPGASPVYPARAAMIRPAAVLPLGSPGLRAVSAPVADVRDPALRVEVARLHATLADFRERNGFGRAVSAPQIGVPRRFIALALAGYPGLLINPEIVWRSEATFTMWDDCMSFPTLLVRLRRHRSISVQYLDEQGARRELAGLDPAVSELLQHEIDHLDGVLAVDHALDRESLVTRQAFEADPAYFRRQVDYVIGE